MDADAGWCLRSLTKGAERTVHVWLLYRTAEDLSRSPRCDGNLSFWRVVHVVR